MSVSTRRLLNRWFKPVPSNSRHSKTRRHGLRLESLENRKLLAAAVLDSIDMSGDPSAPAAVIGSVDAGVSEPSSIADGPIAYIVNGQETSGHESVGIVNGGCTGTLISPTHVLTAAHCVEGYNGGFMGNEDGTFTVGGQTYNTSKITVHPNYNPNAFDAGFDLAIMELDRPVVGITPSDINRTAPQVGQTLTLVGFGEAGTSTNPDYGFGVKHVGTTPIDSVTNEHISWTLDNAGESATAPGDSGGPAFVNVGGNLVVAGVTSGGSGDAHSIGADSFDTRVDTLASWIDAQVDSTTPVDPPVTPPVDPPITPPIDPVDPGNEHSDALQLAQQELADYDADGNGSLTISELTQEFLDYGDSQSEASMYAEYLIEDFDLNGDGQLDLKELTISWGGEPSDNPDDIGDPVDPGVPTHPGDPVDPGSDLEPDGSTDGDSFAKQLATQELADYDSNGDGSLSASELTAEFVDQYLPQFEANDIALSLLDQFDADGDDLLSYTELVVSWGGDQEGTVDEIGGTWSDGGFDDSDFNDGDYNDDIFNDGNWSDDDFNDWNVGDAWADGFAGWGNNWGDDEDMWADETDWWSSAFLLN